MLTKPKTIEQKLAEAFARQVADFLSHLIPKTTQWQYKGYTTYGLSVGKVGATAGVLKAEYNGSSSGFGCVSMDAGIGISPVPFNVNFPLPDTPEKGLLYRKSSVELSSNSFRGVYCSFTGSAGCGPGFGLTFMAMGAKIMPPSLLSPTSSQYLAKVLYYSEAILVVAGIGGSLPDVGVTISLGMGA